MVSESPKGGHFQRYGFMFTKSHAASTLSTISNSALRDDNDDSSYNYSNDADVYMNHQGHDVHNIEKTKSSSSSSSSASNSSHYPNGSDSSRMKNTFINVFSLKNKLSPEKSNSMENNELSNVNSNHSNNSNNGFFGGHSESQSMYQQQQQQQPQTGFETSIVPTTSGTTAASNPNIFKKIISRKALIPRMKAFKRIANDLEVESYPLDDEMNHELMITTAMKDEDEILNTKGSYSSLLKNRSRQLLNNDNLIKFEIINKANESWSTNRRKSSSSLTNSESYRSNGRRDNITNTGINLLKRRASVSSLTPTNTNVSVLTTMTNANTISAGKDNNNRNDSNDGDHSIRAKIEGKNSSSYSLLMNPFETIRRSRKRKIGNYEDVVSTDVEEYLSDDGGSSIWNPMINCKRRLVSGSVTNSPKSPALDPFPSRRNSILMQSMQSTSDDFEQMSLK